MRRNGCVKLSWVLMSILSMASFQTVALAEEATNHGAQLWSDNCARCHNPRPATEFSKQNWQTIMQHMRIRGGLSGEEAREVLAFIVPDYAPTANVSTATTPAADNTSANTTTATDNKAAAIPSSIKTVSTTKVNTAEKNLHLATSTTATTAATKETSKRSGKDIYQQTCVACHGSNGKGSIPGAPDFTKSGGALSQSNAVLLKHIKEGFQKPGDPMAMPAKGGNVNLTDDDMKQVLDYIEQTFKH